MITKRRLTSLIFTLLFLLLVGIFSKSGNSSQVASPPVLSPTPLPLSSQKDTVLSASDSAIASSSARVTKVIDGDTIEIEGGQKIRYIGIDTPETKHPTKGVQCFGKKAYEKNKELVEGKAVRLEKDVSETDRYGRLLRFVYVDGVFINDYLVRQGYALVSTFPPDVKLSEQFLQAEKEARENNRGLWAACK